MTPNPQETIYFLKVYLWGIILRRTTKPESHLSRRNRVTDFFLTILRDVVGTYLRRESCDLDRKEKSQISKKEKRLKNQ